MLALVLVFGFTVTGCRVFSDMEKISNYLSLAIKVGRYAKGPVPLAVKVNLDDDWGSLLNTINGAGVLVSLDLSRCTVTNTEFNPGANGSQYIFSINLPDAVTGITGDFSKFTNLANIRFPASVNIGEVNPFIGCSSLTFNVRGRGDLSTIENGKALVRGGNELISYPSAKGSVTLNNITTVGHSAFYGAGLESIHLPAATNIGEEAFYGNTDLQTLNIPAVTVIGNSAFARTGGADLTITLGRRVETIGTGMFSGVGERKNVTVRTLQGEVENVTAMRDAFRGRGWNEGSFTLAAGRVNGSITLTVEGY